MKPHSFSKMSNRSSDRGVQQASGVEPCHKMKPLWHNVLFWLLIVVYAVCSWHTMLRHEPWRDEAFAWLMARDAGLLEFFRLRAYDWSPALWYLILMPFAKLGFPYLTMSIIHWGLALAVVALFLTRSPFNWWTKILFVFSYFMFWEYVISVRVYTVGILLLFILAALYPGRFKYPIVYGLVLALLFSANLHMCAIAGALCLAYGLEACFRGRIARRIVCGGLIMGLGALALFLQVGIVPVDQVHVGNIGGVFNLGNLINGLAGAFFVGIGPGQLLWPAAVVVLMMVGVVLLAHPMVFFIYFLHTMFLLYSFSNWGGGVRHQGLILMGILFCLWIAKSDTESAWQWRKIAPSLDWRWRISTVVINICLIISLPLGIMMHRMESRYDYSGGKAMAQFILANSLDRYPIAAHRDAQVISILPYLPEKKFWYPTIGEYGTFYRQNRKRYEAYASMSYAEALKRVDRAFPSSVVLIILDAPLDPAFAGRYRLLYKVDTTVFGSDERFYLYERIMTQTG